MGTITIEIPQRTYGAFELKEWIRRYTWRAFIIALVLLALFLIAFFVYNYLHQRALALRPKIPVVRIKLSDLPPPPANQAEVAPPPPTNLAIAGGPPTVAGNPVPVPETLLSPDAKDFANVEDVARATSKGGEGIDMGGFGIGEGTIIAPDTRVQKEQEPDPDEFVFVEKEPEFDYADLQRRVQYPEIARRAGIEGKVIVKVLVGKDGKPKRAFVADSPSEMLNDAALKAVLATTFTPAIQNGNPIDVWVTIPIIFKIK
ncbi:MAG: energy transducer TonB [Bacteroidota bacterium]|nr:energy transducer TonB [Candidatus Kapabacteria bacterium]MCS7302011.1 energy transducer TonB [Candidatus Kapabacteria bacterium]MCX7936811.1 energy transducer TonB [Chlorobiota bacterium]MDW8074530.1 energy transducer TonB [Bacteroidota bacterium]MDW8270994.1 energy transducer TonB [Bacteroidota bacterium]